MSSVDAIRELYQSGLSIRQVATQTGWSSSHVSRQIRDIVRTPDEGRILRWADVKVTPGTYRHRARLLVIRSTKMPLAYENHVHHKNRDYTDNGINNLQVLNRSDHTRLHNPRNPVPRYQRTGRRAWMANYMPTRTRDAKCVICGNEFKANRYRQWQTCSKSCSVALGWRNKREREADR